MKKIYERYIKIPEDKNISDSAFKSRITLSVISILSCFAIMLSTAFAFFNTNLETKFTMRAATWDVGIAETMADGEIREFIFTPCGTATEGYCEIIISGPDGDARYCTTSFTNREIITLSIQATPDCEIKFIPRWGKPSNYGFSNPYGNGDLIVHPRTSTDAYENNESSETAEYKETPSQSSSDTGGGMSSSQPETSSDKTETSGNEEDSSLSGESSNASQNDSVEDTSSPGLDESTSSTENGSSSESDKTSETSTPSQSSSDGDSSSSGTEPESSSSSSADNSSSSDSGTTSDSSSASGDDSVSSSDSSSGGGDSTPAPSATSSGDNGSDE